MCWLSYHQLVSEIQEDAAAQSDSDKIEMVSISEETTRRVEETIAANDTPDITEEEISAPEDIVSSDTQTEAVSLEEVQAIPFDFSINEAADELTLPSSLVSEFIIDFINQAKENLPVLEKAYQDKDIDTLHKTAHTLKGASSNLRITPIADTLYSLQFNDDFEKVPDLIQLFKGQLKALSIQMNQA